MDTVAEYLAVTSLRRNRGCLLLASWYRIGDSNFQCQVPNKVGMLGVMSGSQSWAGTCQIYFTDLRGCFVL